MKLKSFGCSFIFGTDLSDDGRNGAYPTGSKLTWPALLAKNLGHDYQTFARPGSGNLQILERLLTNVDVDDPAIYVIGWTWIDRFDYIDLSLKTPWPGSKWKTLMPIDTTPVAENYYKNLHSEYHDKFISLTYIKTAIDFLKSKNCKFIMTYMDDLLWDTRWNTSLAVSEFQTYCRPYFNNFQEKTFLDWSRLNNFKISDMLHPLEEAHSTASELVLRDLDHWIKS